MKNTKILKITITAILSAFCIILYFFIKFPLPFFPPFLDVNLSMIPALLGGYILGPIYGSLIVVIRFLTKLLATQTAGVGELADLIIGVLTVLVSSLIYRKGKTKKYAIISLLCAIFIWTLSGVIANYIVLVPAYINLYFNGDINLFINICSIIPGINETNYMEAYLLYAALPFNLLLSIVVCTITFFIYKPLRRLINKYFFKTNSKKENIGNK